MSSRWIEQMKIENRTKCVFISSVEIWVQTCMCSEMRNLTYLAENVDISVCVYDYLTYFFRVCKMYLLKVRTMWLIRPVIGHGNKTLTSLSERLSLCVNVCVMVLFTHIWYSCWVLWAPCVRGCCSTRLHRRLATFLGCRLFSIWGAPCRCGPHLKINTNT